jgi:hypothetical protein
MRRLRSAFLRRYSIYCTRSRHPRGPSRAAPAGARARERVHALIRCDLARCACADSTADCGTARAVRARDGTAPRRRRSTRLRSLYHNDACAQVEMQFRVNWLTGFDFRDKNAALAMGNSASQSLPGSRNGKRSRRDLSVRVVARGTIRRRFWLQAPVTALLYLSEVKCRNELNYI